MTPRRLDPQTVRARLRLIREAVEDLERQGDVDAGRLEADRDTRRVVERCLEHLVDVAAAINAHVAAAELGRAPYDLTESFELAAEAGLTTDDLAAELRPSAGMRNVIVHAYLDLDLELVADPCPAPSTPTAATSRRSPVSCGIGNREGLWTPDGHNATIAARSQPRPAYCPPTSSATLTSTSVSS